MEILSLCFEDFVSEEIIAYGVDILCLVSSYEEKPYYVVMQRKVDGLRVALDNSELKNTKILKYAYLTEAE